MQTASMNTFEQDFELVGRKAESRNAPTVAVMSGFWGQNIGNAFFNVGGKWLVEQVFGQENVAFIRDQPGYRTFHKQGTGNPKHDIQLLRYLDADYIVAQGPNLTKFLDPLWRPTFEALRDRGTRFIFLGTAFFRFTAEEERRVREFFKEFPPAILVTRDQYTYDRLHDVCEHSYSGIDSAFFVPKAFQPFELNIEPYICVNFDQYPEPNFTCTDLSTPVNSKLPYQFTALGHNWGARQPAIQMAFANAGQWQTYLGALIDFRKLPSRLANHLVMRPEHRVNPHITWKVYKDCNAVASDEPFTYFTVYKNTQLTLSDRVHACVVTLAYGRPAMLFSPTPRARLMDRLGLGDVRTRPITLDLDYLEQERQNELAFLRRAVNDLNSR